MYLNIVLHVPTNCLKIVFFFFENGFTLFGIVSKNYQVCLILSHVVQVAHVVSSCFRSFLFWFFLLLIVFTCSKLFFGCFVSF